MSSADMATSTVTVTASTTDDEDTYTFNTSFKETIQPLSTKLENGIKSIDTLIEILKLRIDAEKEYSKNLENILTNYDFGMYECGSLKMGLESLKADIKNEHMQRVEFANSLFEDVYQQLNKLRDTFDKQYKEFCTETQKYEKTFEKHSTSYNKIKQKYTKICDDETKARNALVNAKSSSEVLKLGNKVSSTIKSKLIMQDKYDLEKLVYNDEQIKYDNILTKLLNNMEKNEFERIKNIHDALTKWAVFITNLSANRNYDVKSLAKCMSVVDTCNDLQIWIKELMGDIKRQELANIRQASSSGSLDLNGDKNNSRKKTRMSMSNNGGTNLFSKKDNNKIRSQSLSLKATINSDIIALSKETKKIKNKNNQKKQKQDKFKRKSLSRKISFSLGFLTDKNENNNNNDSDDDDKSEISELDSHQPISPHDNIFEPNMQRQRQSSSFKQNNNNSILSKPPTKQRSRSTPTQSKQVNSYQSIWNELINMGFKEKHIKIAFKLFEKKLGTNYNLETLTELVINIQNVALKMKNKKKNPNKLLNGKRDSVEFPKTNHQNINNEPVEVVNSKNM